MNEEIQAHYDNDLAFRSIIDWLAGLGKKEREISVDQATAGAGLLQAEVFRCFRILDQLGYGRLMLGRRGHHSRFIGHGDLSKIGGMARIGQEKGGAVNPGPLPTGSLTIVPGPGCLTIGQAKELLAASLGVPENAIEIIIRG
ncbi:MULTISPECIES: hypothetical protein [unclassified Chelatococcus]|uniref:hypothetical protein n=1 Tax=unclassified Chelatococcus TaxID=2638111 RepID=UPI001BCBEA52|nr:MULTISPECIES: hypothetical protein [unclassified Chelatococcus]MBS7743526.1 hypothetical protein [Chelatococcus sp. HY11]MBS7743693.1 hypothetical protein [Chelatococcus sp. HY11]MBX3547204.1 hypothetical protein [Chelatococcus sp.]